jgi:type II secretory pathway component PulF
MLPEALRLTGVGVADSSVDRACRSMARDIEQGFSLSETMARQSIFPRGLNRVMTWAEGHQSLPETLHMLGEMFEARARGQAGFAGTVLGVLTVIAILFGVAIMVIGLFLPLILLIQRLSG